MKPKNRVMCPDCGRLKILFESESKANNFIKFNKDNMHHGEDLRSYYCPACCGWHISHQRCYNNIHNRTEELINAYKRSQQKWPITYDKKIIELYELMCNHKPFNNRKEVNTFLKTLDYNEIVKFRARVMYYTENNL